MYDPIRVVTVDVYPSEGRFTGAWAAQHLLRHWRWSVVGVQSDVTTHNEQNAFTCALAKMNFLRARAMENRRLKSRQNIFNLLNTGQPRRKPKHKRECDIKKSRYGLFDNGMCFNISLPTSKLTVVTANVSASKKTAPAIEITPFVRRHQTMNQPTPDLDFDVPDTNRFAMPTQATTNFNDNFTVDDGPSFRMVDFELDSSPRASLFPNPVQSVASFGNFGFFGEEDSVVPAVNKAYAMTSTGDSINTPDTITTNCFMPYNTGTTSFFMPPAPYSTTSYKTPDNYVNRPNSICCTSLFGQNASGSDFTFVSQANDYRQCMPSQYPIGNSHSRNDRTKRRYQRSADPPPYSQTTSAFQTQSSLQPTRYNAQYAHSASPDSLVSGDSENWSEFAEIPQLTAQMIYEAKSKGAKRAHDQLFGHSQPPLFDWPATSTPIPRLHGARLNQRHC